MTKECFSFFKAPITSVAPCREIGAEEVVKYLRSEYARERTESVRQARGDERRRIKGETLDFVTFSGVFDRRQQGGLVRHSGLMCFDIDHIGESRAADLKREMAEDETLQPVVIFTSPGGDGLKIVVRMAMERYDAMSEAGAEDTALNQEHRRLYELVAKYIGRRYGVKCDRTQDVARPCFLCHDPEAYYNAEGRTDEERTAEAALELKHTERTGKEKFYKWFSEVRASLTDSGLGTDSKRMNFGPRGKPRIITRTDPPTEREQAERLVAKLEREGKNIAEDYDRWLQVGFALANGLGEEGRDLYHRVSSLSGKYSPGVTDRKYDECLRNGRGQVGLGSLVFLTR